MSRIDEALRIKLEDPKAYRRFQIRGAVLLIITGIDVIFAIILAGVVLLL
jgi:hypothetical protein